MPYPRDSTIVQEHVLNLGCSHHLQFHPVCPCRLQATSTELPPTPSLLRQMERGCVVQFFNRGRMDPRCFLRGLLEFQPGSDGFSTFDFGSRHDGHLQSVATQRRDADYLAVRFSNNRSQHGTAIYPGKETSAVQPCEFATVPCTLVPFDQTQTHIRKHSLPFDSNKSM